VPGYGRGCLTILWHLVFYEVYTKIERDPLLWEMWVDFPYLICIFCVGRRKPLEDKLWAMHFLLVPSSRGVMGAPIHLLRESRHARLIHMADR
jgi:hypothetical protein